MTRSYFANRPLYSITMLEKRLGASEKTASDGESYGTRGGEEQGMDREEKVTCVGGDADHQPQVDEVERILQEERMNRSVSTINTGELRR